MEPPRRTPGPPAVDVPSPRSSPPSRPAASVVPDLAHLPGDGDELVGTAWIVRAVTHVPGVLRLHHGRLSFESTRGVLFCATLAELELEVGRTARIGLRVTVAGERLALHVVRPPGGVPPCDELLARTVGTGPATAGSAEAWTSWHARLAPRIERAPRPRSRVGSRVGRALAAITPVSTG